MKVNLLIIILYFSSISNANSSNDSNERKYSVELGFHSSYFISKNVDNNFKNEWMFFPLISGLGIGYQINKNNKVFFLANRYFNYKLGNTEWVTGDVFRIEYYLGSIGYKRLFFSHKKISFHGIASLNWRYGDESIFRWFYGNESNSVIALYNSPGIGLGSGLNFKLSKRTYLDLDFSFNHFFEKTRLDINEYPSHKPVRNLISGNLKFGMLL